MGGRDGLLVDLFRQNTWASLRLLDMARTLTADQLHSDAKGTYGSIIDTLNHYIRSEAGYLPEAKVARPAWTKGGARADVDNLDELRRRVEVSGELWQRYLDDPLDGDEMLSLDGGLYECRATVPVVQALNHATLHREQVCSILTWIGVEPPDLQAWAWAEDTGHLRAVPG